MNILKITNVCFVSIYDSYLFICIRQMRKSKVLITKKRTDIRCIVIKDFIELLQDNTW